MSAVTFTWCVTSIRLRGAIQPCTSRSTSLLWSGPPLLPKKEFFGVLHKVAGVTLSEEKCLHLAYALSAADKRMSGSGELDYPHGSSEDQGGELDAEYVNYGRFLNVLVPRAASSSPGLGSASRRRLSVSATASASKLSPMAHA